MKFQHLSIFAITIMLLSNCGGKSDKKESENKGEAKKEAPADKAEEKTSQKEEAETEPEKASEEEKAVVTAKSGLSMRETSDRKSKLITVLPTNAIVEVIEKGTENVSVGTKKAPFHKVKYGKYEGYAFGAYLKMGAKIEASNNADAKTANTNEEATNFGDVIQKGLIVAKSGLTLREKPSAKSKSITVIPRNQEVGILNFSDDAMVINGVHGSWCQVRYGKKEGYLFSGYINFSMAKVKAKSGLRLRKEPSKDSDQITVIPSGADVYLIVTPEGEENTDVVDDGTGNLWYKVRYGKYEGYAYGEFLEIEAGC